MNADEDWSKNAEVTSGLSLKGLKNRSPLLSLVTIAVIVTLSCLFYICIPALENPSAFLSKE